jgi:hypothetical protein
MMPELYDAMIVLGVCALIMLISVVITKLLVVLPSFRKWMVERYKNMIAAKKRMLSYFKPRNRWEFGDYPLLITNDVDEQGNPVLFFAELVNWHGIGGFGHTVQEAIESLVLSFDSYRSKNITLPRPGTLFPRDYEPLKIKGIRFETREEISKYDDIAPEFYDRILCGYLKGILFNSDITTLSAYEAHEDQAQAKAQREEVIKRVLEIYGVDIRDIYDGPLYKIFELVKSKLNGAVT